MRDRLYIQRLETPSGNVAHEVVCLVTAAAVTREVQRARETAARAKMREAWAREDVKHRARKVALARLVADWWQAQADGIGKGGKAGW